MTTPVQSSVKIRHISHHTFKLFVNNYLQNDPLPLRKHKRHLRPRRMHSPNVPPFMQQQQRRFYQLRRSKRSTSTENENESASSMTYASFVKHYDPVYETRYKGNPDTIKNRKNKSQKPVLPKFESELEDLADDHFFHDQIRRDRKLRDHSLKKDVEVFDLKQMRRFGESAEDKTTDKPVILIKKGVGSDEKNFEFVHDAKKLGKNAKFRFDLERELKSLKCVECESFDSVPESAEVESNERDQEKAKIIDDFQRRVIGRREKQVNG